MSKAFENWGISFELFVSTALSDFIEQSTEQMAQFAVDCHPWNGSVILAFLTTAEVKELPYLALPEEMAAWKFYDFASARSSSHPDVGQFMQQLYNQADDKNSCAIQFFLVCAEAVASKTVQAILAKYSLSTDFKITVSHPDTGVEYYSPG